MAKKHTLLFVDDEKNILRSLRRLLHRENYEILLASSGQEGLDLLAKHQVDLVMSDMRMPEMNGAVFLKKVYKLYPQTVRLILTGYAEKESVKRAFSEADVHEMISKPWDDDQLKLILRESLCQSQTLDDERLGLHSIINGNDSLPTLPGAYQAVEKALESTDESSTDSVASVIAQDPPLAAGILQVSNSSFFGQRREVDTVSRAIFVLGLDMVRNLVLAAEAMKTLHPNNLSELDMDLFWQHSLAVGTIARHIAQRCGSHKELQETAMLAGNLHALGKLVLAKYAETQYKTVLRAATERQSPIVEIERELLGTDHALVGGYLADWWNLPVKIADAIRHNYHPSKNKTDIVLVHLVHLARVLASRLEIGSVEPGPPPTIAPSVSTILSIDDSEISNIEQSLRESNLSLE